MCELIINRQKRGFPMTLDKARKLVFEYCELNKIPHNFDRKAQRAGWDWWVGFKKRNPEIVLRQPENLSRNRALGMEEGRIKKFFGDLEDFFTINDMKDAPDRIFNVDETGVQTVTQGGKVLAQKGCRNVQIISSAERGSTTTIVAACSASGYFIPPMIIFKGTRKPSAETIESLPQGSVIEMSKSGWIDKDIFLRWFKHFLRFAPERGPNQKLVLIMDGLRSHESQELFQEALKNNVELISLPSHTSNCLQPLDLSVFGPFKRSWRERCRSFLDRNPGIVISKSNFGELFSGAWNTASKAENAISGFRRGGLFPLSFDDLPKEPFLISNELLGASQSSDTDIEIAEDHVEGLSDYTCALDTGTGMHPPVAEPTQSSRDVEDSHHEVIISDEGKDYQMLSEPCCSRNCDSDVNASFDSLVPALHSNRKAALEAFQRMKEPRILKKKVSTTSQVSQLNNNQSDETSQRNQFNNENICGACGVTFDDDDSGVDWLQCMECNRWAHNSCGRCTVGTFFCKFCVDNVLHMLSV